MLLLSATSISIVARAMVSAVCVCTMHLQEHGLSVLQSKQGCQGKGSFMFVGHLQVVPLVLQEKTHSSDATSLQQSDPGWGLQATTLPQCAGLYCTGLYWPRLLCTLTLSSCLVVLALICISHRVDALAALLATSENISSTLLPNSAGTTACCVREAEFPLLAPSKASS